MFSYQLTSENKKYIQTFTKENSSITTTELTQQLLDSYFVGQDVFFYDVYNVISQKKKLINAEHTNYFINESRKIQSSYTEIYKLGLNHVFEREFRTETPQPFEHKCIVLQRPSFHRRWLKQLYEYISTQQDLLSLEPSIAPADFKFQKMRNIFVLVPAATVRTSSDPSLFKNQLSCYLLYST
ncbi:Hypothetical_protein [Hexamita inflata]|uniref:Hypothetical_protein n=1 Tax=Hexamita inflata TaxID=28002 RepID=A0AA86UTF1_9EUKA|nr:Hypothetical protein HINF_LOCUS51812 [Hexamita inflata]